MNYKKITLSLATIATLSTLNGMEFKPAGFKAMGMGGTGAASSRGSLSGYYNPALLRFSDYTTEISVNVGINVRESNLVQNVDDLSKIDFDGTVDRISDNAKPGRKQLTLTVSTPFGDKTQTEDTRVVGKPNKPEDVQNIKTAMDILTNKIGTNNGLELFVNPSFAAQFSDAFAIGIYANVAAGFRINIDPQYNKLIFKDTKTVDVPGFGSKDIDIYYEYDYDNDTYGANANVELDASGNIVADGGKTQYESSSIEYALDNGIDYVDVNGVALAEIPLSYAKVFNVANGTLSVGGSLKPMQLKTYSKHFDLGESSDDIEEDSDDSNIETTYKATLGLDLGIAYRPQDSKLTFGLVGKNLNSPTFKYESGMPHDDYKIDPMIRAGISMPIWNDNIEFALDIDLTKNDTIIEGEKSQLVGAGVELHPASWFSLRVGAMQDLQSEKFDDGTILTAGIGFGLKWFQLDVAAMMSNNTGTYDGDEIPSYTAVNVALVSKWGDGYNRKVPTNQQDYYLDNSAFEQNKPALSETKKNSILQESQKAHKELDNSVK